MNRPSVSFFERVNVTYKSTMKIFFVAIVFALLPDIVSSSVANRMVVFAVFAVGFNLILGYGGELAFGHAAFFGIGGYSTILISSHFNLNVYLSVLISIIISSIAGLVYGAISLRRRGIAFALITLALGQLTYWIIFQWNSVTGGTNGISLPTTNASLGPIVPTQGGLNFYILGLVILLVVWLGSRRFIASPFGRVLLAIRESEQRTELLGYNTDAFLLITFILSAAVAGLAGSLYVLANTFITPSISYWEMSGEVLLMTVLGGVGTLVGPVVGAIIFVLLSQEIPKVSSNWQIYYGIIIMIVVLFAPTGLYGKYRELIDKS